MSERMWWLVVALTGALFVAALVVFGYDIRRAARTGPNWKRRLVAAGLALLGCAGVAAVIQERHENRGTWSCYVPLPAPMSKATMRRIAARLALVETLAKDGKLEPSVAQKLMEEMDSDLTARCEWPESQGLSRDDHIQAGRLREQARKALDELRQHIGCAGPKEKK